MNPLAVGQMTNRRQHWADHFSKQNILITIRDIQRGLNDIIGKGILQQVREPIAVQESSNEATPGVRLRNTNALGARYKISVR